MKTIESFVAWLFKRVEDSEKTMGYRSADLTSGGAEFIQGTAMGAANVVPRKHLKEL